MSDGSTRVVDASVAVKWYVPETGSDVAAAILDSGAELVAPDLLVAELGNVLWKKVRVGELAGLEAEEIVNVFLSSNPIRLYPSTLLLTTAMDIANRFQRPVYDALYLALALAEECVLVTADRRLAQALKGTPLERHVLPIV